MSSLIAIKNPNNQQIYATLIRQFLIEKQPNIKLIWIPGHSGIVGNEIADKTAKTALNAPLITTPNFSQENINYYVKQSFKSLKSNYWNSTSEWYRKVNTNKSTVNEILIHTKNNNISRRDQIKLIRLRLGHTQISHRHLFDKNLTKQCPLCNYAQISLDHLFTNCSHINKFKNLLPNNDFFNIINSIVSDKNLHLLLEFLKKCNLYCSI